MVIAPVSISAGRSAVGLTTRERAAHSATFLRTSRMLAQGVERDPTVSSDDSVPAAQRVAMPASMASTADSSDLSMFSKEHAVS